MAKREYRNLLEKKLEDSKDALLDEINSVVDSVEEKLNEVIKLLENVDETDIESANTAIEESLILLNKLSEQVY